jgi:hypothetical protein
MTKGIDQSPRFALENFWQRSAEKKSLVLVELDAHVCARKERRNIMQDNSTPQGITANEHGLWAHSARSAATGNRRQSLDGAGDCGRHPQLVAPCHAPDVERRHSPPIWL